MLISIDQIEELHNTLSDMGYLDVYIDKYILADIIETSFRELEVGEIIVR